MAENTFNPNVNTNANESYRNASESFSSIAKEISSSAKDLIQSEIKLLVEELKFVSSNLTRHMTKGLIYSVILILSVLPFLAFLVIGLGELLDDRYWLSSLIVSLVMAAIGGPLAMKQFKKIKENDLQMPHMQAVLRKDASVLQRTMNDLKTTVKGEPNEAY